MNKFYVTVTAKLPRKHKAQTFETQLQGDTQTEAVEKARELIKTLDLRKVSHVNMQLWNVSESDFVDSNGEKQVLVTRNIYPSGSAIAIDLALVTKVS